MIDINALTISLFANAVSLLVIVVLSILLVKVQTHGDGVRNELINKLMSKDFKDYAEGTERIGLVAAAQARAEKAKKDAKEMDDEFSEAEAEDPDLMPVT